MPEGVLTLILVNFKTIFVEGIKNLTPYAISLMVSLATLEFLLSHMWAVMGEPKNQIEILFKNVIKIGLFIWFVTDYTTLIGQVQAGFVKIGLVAGGNRITEAVATDPSYVSDMGYALMEKVYTFTAPSGGDWSGLSTVIAAAKGELTVAKLFPNLFMFSVSLFVWIAYLVIAIQIFLTFLEFYIFGAVIPVLLPFGVLRYTKFIADKAIGVIVASGIKISILIFIMSATIPLIETWTLPANPTNAQCLRLLAGSAAIAFLCWHAPSMAAGAMSGGPSLSAGAVGSAVGGALLAGGALVGAVRSGVMQGLSLYNKASGGVSDSPYKNASSTVNKSSTIKP